MISITEGTLTFSFRCGCEASKYDVWSFYRNQFQNVAGGSKAVDILCLYEDTAWLVEVKDYRRHRRAKVTDLAEEVAIKVRDTLAGLAAAAKNANDSHERQLAKRALRKPFWRVVLHLEQPARHKLWPTPVDPANVSIRLRSGKLKAIDAHPLVADRNNRYPALPWTVS